MATCHRGGGRHRISFCDVISVENLFAAWREFCRGKRGKRDVLEFELKLEDNLFLLHQSLTQGSWEPDAYASFFVRDPKLRRIHKASVKDRVLYQAVYRALYPIFDPTFIHDSYSSRNGKGTHRGVKRLKEFGWKVTRNFRANGYVLKCDIRKFFDSIDHEILLGLIRRKIQDKDLLGLIEKIISSFGTIFGKGLPLGNVTSQLFSNIYLNELDQFVKCFLKQRYYIRYCDDFVILGGTERELRELIFLIGSFLEARLALNLHPRKVEIRKILRGVDFLGYVVLPHRIVLRTKTKRRMLRRVNKKNHFSYLGICKHAKAYALTEEMSLKLIKH